MSKVEDGKETGTAINRRTFIKVSGMATGTAMLGGFHFVVDLMQPKAPSSSDFPYP